MASACSWGPARSCRSLFGELAWCIPPRYTCTGPKQIWTNSSLSPGWHAGRQQPLRHSCQEGDNHVSHHILFGFWALLLLHALTHSRQTPHLLFAGQKTCNWPNVSGETSRECKLYCGEAFHTVEHLSSIMSCYEWQYQLGFTQLMQ